MVIYIIQKLKKTTQKHPIDIWFFFLFLLTFSLSVRKVIDYFPVEGTSERTFNEYTGIYVYVSDIFLFLTILFWIAIRLYDSIDLLSNKYDNKLWITQLIHKLFFKFTQYDYLNVKCSTWNIFNKLKNNWYISLPLAMVVLSFISISWSINKPIALFRSLKLLEYFLLYIYIIYRLFRLPRRTDSRAILLGGQAGVEHKNRIFDRTIKIILFVSLIQSIIAIAQFVLGHSIGLFLLKESQISPNLSGVAKIAFNGQKFIRAYGLFPHPNVLGGFLSFSIILTWFYSKGIFISKNQSDNNVNNTISHKLFHVEQFIRQLRIEYALLLEKANMFFISFGFSLPAVKQLTEIINVPRGTSVDNKLTDHIIQQQLGLYKQQDTNKDHNKQGFWKNLKQINVLNWLNRQDNSFERDKIKNNDWDKRFNFNIVSRGTLLYILILLQLISLILTFSKSAILALTISVWYIWFRYNRHIDLYIVPRGTILFIRTHARKIVLSGLIVVLFLMQVNQDISNIFLKSLNERLFYLNVSRGTILNNFFLGVGEGQSVLAMPKYALDKIEVWQYQPVHNVPLEIWSELGIIGLILFSTLIYRMFHMEHLNGTQRNKQNVIQIKNPIDPHREVPLPASGDVLATSQSKNMDKDGNIILNNNNNILSSKYCSICFTAILLGFGFIMLFDHYLWDIQPGSFLLWMIFGFIVGLNKR